MRPSSTAMCRLDLTERQCSRHGSRTTGHNTSQRAQGLKCQRPDGSVVRSSIVKTLGALSTALAAQAQLFLPRISFHNGLSQIVSHWRPQGACSQSNMCCEGMELAAQGLALVCRLLFRTLLISSRLFTVGVAALEWHCRYLGYLPVSDPITAVLAAIFAANLPMTAGRNACTKAGRPVAALVTRQVLANRKRLFSDQSPSGDALAAPNQKLLLESNHHHLRHDSRILQQQHTHLSTTTPATTRKPLRFEHLQTATMG